MGLFDKPREEKARRREYAKQELMALSEKELLVEILLELKELNEQSEKIKRNQLDKRKITFAKEKPCFSSFGKRFFFCSYDCFCLCC